MQQVLLVVLVALLSAALWYGWFAWDTGYYYDTTGALSGPYEAWQGVGAFLCGLVVIAIAYCLLRFGVALLVLPASFTLAWITTAVAEAANSLDASLWPVGALFLLVGLTLGTALLLWAATGIEVLIRRFRDRASSRDHVNH